MGGRLVAADCIECLGITSYTTMPCMVIFEITTTKTSKRTHARTHARTARTLVLIIPDQLAAAATNAADAGVPTTASTAATQACIEAVWSNWRMVRSTLRQVVV